MARRFQIDFTYLFIAAIISFIITLFIIQIIKLMQPGAVEITPGTGVFIYIGVFSANLLMELFRQRTGKH